MRQQRNKHHGNKLDIDVTMWYNISWWGENEKPTKPVRLTANNQNLTKVRFNERSEDDYK